MEGSSSGVVILNGFGLAILAFLVYIVSPSQPMRLFRQSTPATPKAAANCAKCIVGCQLNYYLETFNGKNHSTEDF